MDVQLYVVALTKGFPHDVVPFIGPRLQFFVLILILPESELLHYFGVERASDPQAVIDAHKTAQRLKLQATNVARAVATQFPVVNESKVYGRHCDD